MAPRFPAQLQRPLGVTPSERTLKRLCDRSFLSLWSHASVFRDQGNSHGREGKEICDVLVVFGNHVLIFSDKHCKFPSSGDIRKDWGRWYRSAIADSAKQIFGAERWLRAYPSRVFRDRACTQRLPVSIPSAADAVIHRIIVAHGSGPACVSHFRGGSGSLLLDSTQVGVNSEVPFTVGFVDDSRRLVHVLDDTTFELLLRALDTVTDFVDYLAAKEALFASRTMVMATGEEELLGRYFKCVDPKGQRHSFAFPENADGIFLAEGEWHSFATSSAAISQVRADEVSYLWDRIIEKYALSGAAPAPTGSFEAQVAVEPMLRLMAAEPRAARRWLANSLISVADSVKAGKPGRAARLMHPVRPVGPAYLILVLEPPPGCPKEEYLRVRKEYLHCYLRVAKLKLPRVTQFVGIATEPGSTGLKTEDLAVLDTSTWTADDEEEARSLQEEFRLLTNVSEHHERLREYPNQSRRPPVPMSSRRNPRNCTCSCGSGLKYKKCCGRK